MATETDWLSGDAKTGLSAILRYSQVSFFVDAEEYYADLRSEVTNAADHGEGLVCWIGFDAATTVPMPLTAASPILKPFARRAPESTDRAWGDLLAGATNRGVYLRALLNLHPSPKPPDRYCDANFTTVEMLNRFKNTLAINDFRYLFMNGTHHQKLVVVRSPQRVVAYVGTMDVHWQRINDRWCEVGCRVQGEAARELYRVFYDRWVEHSAMLAGLPRERSWVPKPEDLSVSAGGGKLICQTSSTFGNPQRSSPFRLLGSAQQTVNQPHRLRIIPSVTIGRGFTQFLSGGPIQTAPIDVGNDFFIEKEPAAPALIDAARKQAATYWFARTGRTGIYHQIEAAIGHTRQFIYMEDQYLVDDMPMGALAPMLNLLEQRVKDDSFRKLIILSTRIDEINSEFQGLAGPHRRAFVERLVAAGGDKVVVTQYKSNATLGNGIKPDANSPFYVHSKTWIFDDELLIVGSANCNRRGYSHDSELDFAVYDVEKAAIRDLRTRIWLRRLNTETLRKALTEPDVRDFLAASRYWEKPDDYGLILENHRMGIDAFIPNSRPEKIVYDSGGYGPVVDVLALAKSGVASWLWDVVVDPDGT